MQLYEKAYLGKEFLLLPQQLLLGDAEVLQAGAGLPPLQGHRLALLQHVLHLRDVRGEAQALQSCGDDTAASARRAFARAASLMSK